MAYARPFGQAQSASPWSAGVPPGLQQQPQPAQQMFNQPMGAFDLSGAWQGQQPAGQWAPPSMQSMQPPVQFVPNPNAFMQQQPPQQQHRFNNQQHHQHQQRPMHQRSLSAPRSGVNGLNKRAFGQGGNGGGGNGGSQWQQRQQNNNANNNNNNNVHQQRTARQQSRQKVQFNVNNSNNNNSAGGNANNNRQQNQQRQQQQQQSSKRGTVKVTKVIKRQTLKAKQGDSKAKSADSSSKNDNADASVEGDGDAANDDIKSSPTQPQNSKPQSKTAERKQYKMQARKNAEALKKSKLAIAQISGNSTTNEGAGPDDATVGGDAPPIDQAQLRCVPAVFGFVCKACDVFLRDRNARREHIDSDEHLQRFKVYEEQLKLEEAAAKVEETTPIEIEETDKSAADSSEVEKEPSIEEEQKPEVSSNELEGDNLEVAAKEETNESCEENAN